MQTLAIERNDNTKEICRLNGELFRLREDIEVAENKLEETHASHKMVVQDLLDSGRRKEDELKKELDS